MGIADNIIYDQFFCLFRCRAQRLFRTDALEHVNTPGNNAVSAYYHLAAIGPKSIRVGLLARPSSDHMGFDSFYFKISPSTHAKPEMGEYECINDLFFVHSKYSSKIIALDPHSLKTVRSFLITTAENTSTHLTGIELPATENPNIQDSVNIRLATGGYISAIQYDKPTGHYIVSLVHSVGPSQPLDERGVARRFSLLEYDGDFKMVREQVFPAKKYKMFFMLPLQTGTFIQRWEDKQTAMSGTHTFERLNIGVE
ncbi:MAG: hypothetical protein IPP33_18455 [Flavobacteriales bacterium]|nr:hypothetical protein [Flavobacteriales bacterium]